jgi:thiol-disulfide isomerase/thioredoxin
MKYLLLLIVLFFSTYIFAQNADSNLKYFTILPVSKILKIDSTKCTFASLFKKNKPVVAMLFSPDCDHCQHQVEMIQRNMDSLKGINFVLISNRPLFMLKDFYKKYNFKKYKNMSIINDADNTIARFFRIGAYPTLTFYNKNLVPTKQYVSAIVGWQEILKYANWE